MMLRYYLQLFRGQRVRSEVIENEIDASTSGPGDEGGIHGAHTMSTNDTGAQVSNLLCTQKPQEDSREECLEVRQICAPHQYSQWVEVKLATERLNESSIDEDQCKVELKVIGRNGDDDAECSINPCTMLTTSASQSHDCDRSIDNRNIIIEQRIQQQRQSQQQDISVHVQSPSLQRNISDPYKFQERTFPRTVSTVSTDSLAEYCRICQQPMDEPLIELGCHCRGELAKAHRTCIQQWFNNKGTNKCEVCRCTATNLQAPIGQPLQNFWAWRLSQRHQQAFRRWQRRGRFHPLLAALLILIAGLLFDVLISYYLGASALPVNIIIGVLVVLGLGTAARLIVECCHERNVRRSIQRMEMAADMELSSSR